MKHLRLLVVVLLFLLFASFASAEIVVKYTYSDEPQTIVQQQPVQQDVDVVIGTATYTSSSDISICACSDYTESFKIMNSGSGTEFYELKSNLDFVQLTPSTFELAPGAIKEVALVINAPCKSLDKELKIKIFNSQGLQGILSKNLLIGKCQNLDVKLSAEKSDFKPCEVMNHELIISNVGPFTETYQVTSNLNMEPQTVEILPTESEVLELESAFECGVYGEQTVVFTVEALNNQLLAEVSHDVIIEKDYDFSLDVDSEYNFCEEKTNHFSVDIEKDSDVPNNYFIELIDAPNFINLSVDELFIDANEDSASFDLSLDLKEGKNLGTYNFVLQVTSEYGELVQEKNITLNINNCYDLSAEIVGLEKEFCAENQEFQLKITNHGTMDQEVNIDVSHDTINLEDEDFEIAAGEEILLDGDFKPEDLSSELNLLFSIYYDNTTISLDKKVKIHSLWDCYKVSVSKTKQSVRYNKDVPFKVILKNEGIKGGLYDVSLEANPVLPYTLISDENLSAVELYPGEQKVFYVTMNYSEANFTTYEGFISIDYETLEYGQPIFIKVKDKSLCLKTYEYFKSNPCYLVSLVLVVLIILFFFLAIFAKKRRTKLRKKYYTLFTLLLILILIVSACLLVYLKGMPRLNEPIDYSEASETNYIWAQDTVYKVPVEDIVLDPDTQDELTVQFFEESSHVELVFEKEFLKFVPEEGWFGQETVFILAKDNKGAFAISPEITLNVVQRDHYTLVSAYQKLCTYFNWLFLLILFIFVLVVAFKRFRRKPKKPVRKAKKTNKRR